MNLWGVLLILIVVTLVLMFVFTLGQVIFLYLIIAICALYLYSSFVDFINKYIVLIGSFINKKIIYEINNIIRAARKTEVIGKFVKQFLYKIDPVKIICFDEPYGFHILGFQTNKGCTNLLKKQQRRELKRRREERNYKKNKYYKKNKKKYNSSFNIIYIFKFILVLGCFILSVSYLKDYYNNDYNNDYNNNYNNDYKK